MVLESIINPEKAESKPWLMIFIGFLYTSVAMLLGYWIFKSYSSLFMIFLATIASVPIVYRLIKMEEQKDLIDMEESMLLKEHYKALKSFMYLFIGATLCFALWYTVLPADTVSILFESQSQTIVSINGRTTYIGQQVSEDAITGNMPLMTGHATDEVDIPASSDGEITGKVLTPFDAFKRIFFNNIKVMIFCVLFSFLYGAGALFILLWNASVIGTAIGNFIRSSLAEIAVQFGGIGVGHYFSIVSIGLFKYVIHGVPEILAYFVAALAGGIISIAIINHDVQTRKFEHILLDSADLMLLAIAIVFVAALLEVYVTPAIF